MLCIGRLAPFQPAVSDGFHAKSRFLANVWKTLDTPSPTVSAPKPAMATAADDAPKPKNASKPAIPPAGSATLPEAAKRSKTKPVADNDNPSGTCQS